MSLHADVAVPANDRGQGAARNGTIMPRPEPDCHNAAVPRIAIGCYSIWRDEQLVYVGVAGRALDPAKVATLRLKKGRPRGLYYRLKSHASDRRSGDQFCV